MLYFGTDQSSLLSSYSSGGPIFYSGVDLHKDNAFIATVNVDGGIVRQERVSDASVQFLSYFTALPIPHRAVVECTVGWYWLDYLRTAHGIELELAHAKYLKEISYAKVKTP
jgi:hypothetical protein